MRSRDGRQNWPQNHTGPFKNPSSARVNKTRGVQVQSSKSSSIAVVRCGLRCRGSRVRGQDATSSDFAVSFTG